MQGNIVLVGVGGTGVSALAGLFYDLGYRNIVGIDGVESQLTQQLSAKGLQIIIGHGNYQVTPDDKVIYSAAVAESPEVQAAHGFIAQNPKRIFPPLLYAQFLGEISKYMCTVAVTGTHGKSTTTALTAIAAYEHHPAFGVGIVGANVAQRNNQNYLTKSTTIDAVRQIIDHIFDPKAPGITEIMKQYLFVIEADEYNRHFLYLDADYAIITNIELDHTDIYGDATTYMEAFHRFTSRVRYRARMLDTAPGVQEMKTHPQLTVIPTRSFSFTYLLGAHNHGNASLALACINDLVTHASTAIPLEDTSDLTSSISLSLVNFRGLRRRGELLGHNEHGVPIISDYGHHPTELASTLRAIKEKYPEHKILCIFQPHQARRVIEFYDKFIEALSHVDQLVIYDIYAARETLAGLLQEFSQHADTFGHLQTIDQLGELFSTTAGGSYTTDFGQIQQLLTTTRLPYLIAIFTAGNLDFQIRNFLIENKRI